MEATRLSADEFEALLLAHLALARGTRRLARCHAQAVSRSLRDLEADGVVRLGRESIELVDRSR